MTADHPVARMAHRAITRSQLARLGLSEVAYLRPIVMDGAQAWAIHGADGTPMAIAPDQHLAVEAIEQQEMVRVALH